MKNPAIPTPARPARSLELPRMATHFQNSVAILDYSYERAGRAALVKSSILPGHPQVLKIALGKLASEAVAALGDYQLAIIAEGDATTPEAFHGRCILMLLPITKQLADDMFRVARGTHKAVRIPTTKSKASLPLTSSEIRNA